MHSNIDLSLLDPILEKYRGQEDALITMLQEIQEVYGYLPEEALAYLSQKARVPMSQIYGVATFYAQFYLTPRSRNTVRICRGTACHVRGSGSILRTVSKALGVNEGETTDDMRFSLETVRCLGTCFLAPVMMINRSYYGKLNPQKARAVIDSYSHPAEGDVNGKA
jgi:NADH:ubiquinone oxidoreductase subunit E